MSKRDDKAPESLPTGEASGTGAGTPANPDLEFSAEQIREARKQASLTQAELAEKLDVSTRTVARWESGEAEPSIAQKRRIAATTMGVGLLAGHAAAAGAVGAVAAGLLGPLGPLAGLAAMGAGAWFAGNSAANRPTQPVLPERVRDALLVSAEQLDLSPRVLRGALASLLGSAVGAGHRAVQLRNMLAHESELPNAMRGTMMDLAEGLDRSPRQLRTALFAVLNAADASGLSDEQLQTLLLGGGGHATG